jgi:hypothetical protein
MTTGAQLDVGLADSPLHQFDLTYEVLRDQFNGSPPEFRIMGGFFGAISGNLGRFLFPWVDDRSVQKQIIATTDGTAHQWPLVRTFGEGDYSWTEPVGYVDLLQDFNVYFDDVLQDHSQYTVVQTVPGLQQLDWVSTPSAGKVITVDMSYYYYCKLADDNLSFEKFMRQLWALKKIKLQSCRAGT